jgi:NTE family protein
MFDTAVILHFLRRSAFISLQQVTRALRLTAIAFVALFALSFALALFADAWLLVRQPPHPFAQLSANTQCKEPANFNRDLDRLTDDIVLALSGGGYRATMYHLGALRRMNVLGMLANLRVVSSVSGGSVLAGVLAQNWHLLRFNPRNGIALCFEEAIAKPLEDFSSVTIDWPVFLASLPSSFRFMPGLKTAEWLPLPGNRLASAYQAFLYGKVPLGEIGKSANVIGTDAQRSAPSFVFNATNLQTTRIWRFSKEVMGDVTLGSFPSSRVQLSTAVAASSGFPPFLSPLSLHIRSDTQPVTRPSDVRVFDHSRSVFEFLRFETLGGRILLADGGVGDNLGLEASYAELARLDSSNGVVIFASDAGSGAVQDATPGYNWISQSWRSFGIIWGQGDFARVQALISTSQRARSAAISTGGALEGNIRDGIYWSIAFAPYDHSHPRLTRPVVYVWPKFGDGNNALGIPDEQLRCLAGASTRLALTWQNAAGQLQNWGYASFDNALPFLSRLWVLDHAHNTYLNKSKTKWDATAHFKLPRESVGFGPC